MTEKKSKEELEKEQQEAKEKLEGILKMNRPKNIQQGASQGVSNILAGAVGGVGIVVLAPTLGLAAGLQHGGIIGGALGVAGGAVIGAVGGAALIIGGALSGVTQMVRGVAAVPQQIMAPRQGKWWNDATHEWVKTDLSSTTVPDNDDDLLKPLEDDLDAQAKPSGSGGKTVKDDYYYNVLEVKTDAEPSAIKRKYYVLARKYHPDKVTDPAEKEEAAKKFQEIAEAYQVLSDPKLREKYDMDGREALSADKTDINDQTNVDPAILFAFLFGSDKFNDYVGRLATATSALVGGDSAKLSVKEARTLQARRVARLALKLASKLDQWVSEDYELCKTMWKTEAEELTKASYGYELVTLIGMVYQVTAVQFLGSNESGLGMPGIAKWAEANQARLTKRKAENKNKMETLRAGLDLMKMQAEAERKMQAAKTDEEKEKIKQELQEAAQETMLRIFWTTTAVDITSTIHEACQMVFFDQSVDKETRERRAHGVKALGEIFQAVPEPTGEKKDARTLYEEAAFAAMLETVKRKDEAAHGASS